ncbi:hypothetical protein MUK42_03121 [Musa troglodytarum]|uniref:Uncharacterized protein n=1 Tax=Musa troglodytarum TaxID=320322 RepID=A0A9E7G0A7_9LILI|nr:hypothetical protein MUK42_03121 [Musa troglodytarum]
MPEAHIYLPAPLRRLFRLPSRSPPPPLPALR